MLTSFCWIDFCSSCVAVNVSFAVFEFDKIFACAKSRASIKLVELLFPNVVDNSA
ncbi:hypothetical protein [Rickettsia conorii]|uniref:hypothetical protein n=1 Tax=Rickettsia conorii TaxID=781 RepID=UPI00226089D9|nr:hypothetical protein [Rickettsia conorii]UZW39176.1 hypothetical protein OSR38_02780 [Rickettsia conorii subsp. heilongjiangensis]